MTCLQIARPGISPVVGISYGLLKRRATGTGAFSLRCGLTDEDDGTTGEEATESLFMKELKRRGMSPTTPRVEGRNKERYRLGGMEKENGGERSSGGSKRNGIASADYEKSLENQRERSMALNSEGLEGLIPRAKSLLTFGATFFLGFGPLILITIASFSALYLFFGPSFVHGASNSVSPTPYVDPYALLEDETLSQMAPPL